MHIHVRLNVKGKVALAKAMKVVRPSGGRNNFYLIVSILIRLVRFSPVLDLRQYVHL